MKRISLPSATSLTLWLGAIVGVIGVLPFTLVLAPDAIDSAAEQMGLPVGTVLTLSVLQSAILLIPVTLIGLWAARKLGLGAPILDAVFSKRQLPFNLMRNAGFALLAGAGVGILIVGLEVLLFVPHLPEIALLNQSQPAAWKGFLASFYGGITEELQLRLFVLSLLALGLRYITRLVSGVKEPALPTKVFVFANVLAAVLFGVAHLPAMADLVALTPLIVTRVLFLNGIVGFIAGMFFWRRGIEMAMVFHFSVDIILHVLVPLLFT